MSGDSWKTLTPGLLPPLHRLLCRLWSSSHYAHGSVRIDMIVVLCAFHSAHHCYVFPLPPNLYHLPWGCYFNT